MMSSRSTKFVDFMVFLLVVIFTGSYFMPDHFGAKCSQDAPPMGPLYLTIFYILWTCYTIRTIKNDPLIDIENQTRASMWATFKQLCLHEFEGDFNLNDMLRAQRQMYMITSIFNLILQILLIVWQFISFIM